MSEPLSFPAGVGGRGPARHGGGPASHRVYEDLRYRIVALAVPPDTTLDRAQIAARFGVSQSPVRDALRQLEQDGLVKAFPQSRTVVTRIDLARIREEHFLRMAAECEVVRTLARQGGKAALTTARGLLRMQDALVGDVEQIDLFRQLDDAFHECLFEGGWGSSASTATSAHARAIWHVCARSICPATARCGRFWRPTPTC
ncbi:MAG: hypothetical protein AcusKO_32160 [Acuticoccus sp.]